MSLWCLCVATRDESVFMYLNIIYVGLTRDRIRFHCRRFVVHSATRLKVTVFMPDIDASAVSAPVNEAQTGSAFIEPHSESEVCLSAVTLRV